MRYRIVAIVVMLCGCGTGAGDLPGVALSPGTVLAAAAPRSSDPPSRAALSVDDVWALHDRLVACLAQPRACVVETLTADASPAHSDLTQVVESRRRDGLEAQIPNRPPNRSMLRLQPVGDRWFVELCWIDDLVLYQTSDDRQPPIVVDDGVLTVHERWTVGHDDDDWQLLTRTVVDMTPEVAPWCR